MQVTHIDEAHLHQDMDLAIPGREAQASLAIESLPLSAGQDRLVRRL